MTLKTLRFGLIGGGRWAAIHRDAIHRAGHLLAGVCVRSAERQAELQATWEVPVTTDMAALLAGDIDAVVVASPNDLHAAHAIAALQAGKHVLVEKPMALTVQDCDAMQVAAAQAKRLLVPAMQMRLFGHFAALHELLPGLGPLRHIALHLWRKPHGGGAGSWRSTDARRGSLWLEEPIHYLDLLAWCMGSAPAQLTAWQPAPGVMQARLGWPGGAAATLEYSLRAAGHAVTVRAVGEQASAELSWDGSADRDPQPRVVLNRISEGRRDPVPVPQACGHLHDGPKLLAAFAAACAAPNEDLPTGLLTAAEGAHAVAWCLAAAHSCTSGKAVELRQDLS